MKSVCTLFLASTLIFLFTSPSLSLSLSLSSRATVEDDVVYDFEGNELLEGVSYTMYTAPIWPLARAVRLANASGDKETCEVDVVVSKSQFDNGTPFTITPVTPNERVIKLGYPVAIQSPTENPCGESTIWKVSGREGLPVNIVTTGGYFNTPNSCFRIIKAQQALFPNTYTFENCPNLCGVGVKMCYPIGLYDGNNNRYSHLSPFGAINFEVVFFKEREPVTMI